MYRFAISANTDTSSSGMAWFSPARKRAKAKVIFLGITSVSSNSTEISWKQDCSDDIKGFNIHYRCYSYSYEHTSCDYHSNFTIEDPTATRAIIGNLIPYTKYVLTVTALTKDGKGSCKNAVNVTTLEAAPSTSPQNLTISCATNTTMLIAWNPPKIMNGILRYYEVRYNEHVTKVEDYDFGTELTDLLPYKNYSISVAACTISCSERSPELNGVTNIGMPGKIDLPHVHFISSDQLTVKWNKPKDASGPVNYYELKINEKGTYDTVDTGEIYS